MMRNGHQIFTWRGFHRLSAVHHVDFVSPLAEHLQVMAYQQNGGIAVLIQTG